MEMNLGICATVAALMLTSLPVSAQVEPSQADIEIENIHTNRTYTCYAHNRRGHWFVGHGSTRYRAAERALRHCDRDSAQCFLYSCN